LGQPIQEAPDDPHDSSMDSQYPRRGVRLRPVAIRRRSRNNCEESRNVSPSFPTFACLGGLLTATQESSTSLSDGSPKDAQSLLAFLPAASSSRFRLAALGSICPGGSKLPSLWSKNDVRQRLRRLKAGLRCIPDSLAMNLSAPICLPQRVAARAAPTVPQSALLQLMWDSSCSYRLDRPSCKSHFNTNSKNSGNLTKSSEGFSFLTIFLARRI
jgi:hypothetical protein